MRSWKNLLRLQVGQLLPYLVTAQSILPRDFVCLACHGNSKSCASLRTGTKCSIRLVRHAVRVGMQPSDGIAACEQLGIEGHLTPSLEQESLVLPPLRDMRPPLCRHTLLRMGQITLLTMHLSPISTLTSSRVDEISQFTSKGESRKIVAPRGISGSGVPRLYWHSTTRRRLDAYSNHLKSGGPKADEGFDFLCATDLLALH